MEKYFFFFGGGGRAGERGRARGRAAGGGENIRKKKRAAAKRKSFSRAVTLLGAASTAGLRRGERAPHPVESHEHVRKIAVRPSVVEVVMSGHDPHARAQTLRTRMIAVNELQPQCVKRSEDDRRAPARTDGVQDRKQRGQQLEEGVRDPSVERVSRSWVAVRVVDGVALETERVLRTMQHVLQRILRDQQREETLGLEASKMVDFLRERSPLIQKARRRP